jgi:uncharacterized ion transporter superfamily protein YfcC
MKTAWVVLVLIAIAAVVLFAYKFPAGDFIKQDEAIKRSLDKKGFPQRNAGDAGG